MNRGPGVAHARPFSNMAFYSALGSRTGGAAPMWMRASKCCSMEAKSRVGYKKKKYTSKKKKSKGHSKKKGRKC